MTLEKPRDVERREIPVHFDRIYVLAHGEPNRPLSTDSKIRILAAMELAKNNKDAEIFFVGGGRPEEGKPTAEQMEEYFARINKSQKKQLENKTEILDKSNNTVANIEEIIDSLACTPQEKHRAVVVLSNEYHTNRIKQILDNLGLEAGVLPAEDLLQGRGAHHQKFIEKYEGSLGYKEKEIIDKLMCVYLKFDPEQSLVQKFRAWHRKNQ
jgi:uncharacterized SAM-binding protein YcdF (DUF218 family)